MERTCVVTGAAGGIGSATVKRFLESGYRVIACGHNEDSLEGLMAELDDDQPVEPATLNVSDKSNVYETFGSFGDFDVLVAGAGICRQARLDDADSDEVWSEVLGVNLDGVYYCFRAAAEWMNDSGSIVAISSGLGKNGRPGYEAYTASKHGILGLVKCAAPELSERDIRVNAVCPGWVDTSMARSDIETSADEADMTPEEFHEEAVADIPMERMVEPEEVADLTHWLASDEASAITGQSYNIAGGEFTN